MSITSTLSGGIQNTKQVVNEEYQAFENERLKLVIDSEPFEATIKARTTTTKKLGMEVNRILKPIMSDYAGCTIGVNNSGELSMNLFFTDMGEAQKDTIKSVCSIATYQANKNIKNGNKNTEAVMSRITAFNNRDDEQNLTINEQTREVLTDLMPYNIKANKSQRNMFWNNAITQLSEMNRMGGRSIYVQVAGLDVSKILRLKYGNKEGKSYLDYAIQLIRPVVTNGMPNTNYLITISQLNNDQLKELCNEIGMIVPTGEIAMIRA